MTPRILTIRDGEWKDKQRRFNHEGHDAAFGRNRRGQTTKDLSADRQPPRFQVSCGHVDGPFTRPNSSTSSPMRLTNGVRRFTLIDGVVCVIIDG